MNIKRAFQCLLLPPLLLGLYGACSSSNKPTTPNRPYSLAISTGLPNGLRASVAGSGQDQLLYRIDGAGVTLTGSAGPFASLVGSGSYNFTIDNVPAANNLLLSVQLNDVQAGIPLAVGATRFNTSNSVGAQVVVDLGSISRGCYQFTSGNSIYGYGLSYGFSMDTLLSSVLTGPAYDISFSPMSGSFQMQSAAPGAPNNVAFLGKGNWVDFDFVPPSSSFYAQSSAAKAAMGAPVTTIEQNDIYCVELGTLPGGHAWVQITDPGIMSLQGPHFIFRVNEQLPYYAYQQTQADLTTSGNCRLLCPGAVGNSTYATFANNYQPTSMWFAAITLSAPATLEGLSFYSPGPPATQPVTCETAVYSNSGTNPSALIQATAVQVHSSGGWYTAPLNPPLALPPAVYWLGVHSDAFNAEFATGTSATYTVPAAYGVLPSSLNPVSITSAGYKLLVYGIYCP